VRLTAAALVRPDLSLRQIRAEHLLSEAFSAGLFSYLSRAKPVYESDALVAVLEPSALDEIGAALAAETVRYLQASDVLFALCDPDTLGLGDELTACTLARIMTANARYAYHTARFSDGDAGVWQTELARWTTRFSVLRAAYVGGN
jgi:hypothetical protein